MMSGNASCWRQAAELTHFGDSSQVSLLIEVKAGRLCGSAGREPGSADDEQQEVGASAHGSSEAARLD